MYGTKLAGMRLSLSKKEVAEIHLMLTTLPIPPIPVVLTMVYEHLEDSELKAAFEMATSSLVQDARTDDGIVNSHSIIAALSLFAKWSASTGANPLKKQEEMQNNKDASLLRIISSVLDYNDNTTTGLVVDAKDDEILQIFIKASQEWINTYLPDDISVTIRPAPNNKTIGFEHDLHIAMAHYCYSQGVLYNSKKSTLMCKVHDGLYNDFLEKQKNATEDDETETAACAVEHMEIAAMYSQFPYHKMMLLCYERLLHDCLYGHTTPVVGGSVQQNARDLLKMSFSNYKNMTSKTISLPSSKEPTSCATPAPTAAPSVLSNTIEHTTGDVGLSAAAIIISETSPQPVHASVKPIADATPLASDSEEKEETPPISPESTPAVVLAAKHGCAADMGSYKSSVGIFILGIVNFLQKDDPYCMQNMSTSLRHLSELMVHGNDKAKEACALINISELVKLVRSNIEGLSQSGTISDIHAALLEIEQLQLVNSTTPPAITVADTLLVG